jgi:hypothetical protein
MNSTCRRSLGVLVSLAVIASSSFLGARSRGVAQET